MVNLKSLSKTEFPRERLEKYGPAKLKDFELLAILLGSGIKGKNVLSLSKIILKRINTFGMDKITLHEIQDINGIGVAKASQVLALIELSKRFSQTKPEILSSQDIWNICADIRSSKKEHFVAFYLDTQSRLIERQVISIGTLSTSLIHPRELFEPAITLHAASLIIAHNHPSGSLEPSDSDRKITKKLVESGKLLGIPVEKHIIVTSTSLREV